VEKKVNPNFLFEDGLDEAQDSWQETIQRQQEFDDELNEALRPSEEEMAVRTELLERSVEVMGLDRERLSLLKKFADSKYETIERYKERPRFDFELLPPIVYDPPPPPPPSRDFWWAKTMSFHHPEFSSRFGPEGLVFTGGLWPWKYSGAFGETDYITRTFRAVAYFEITPDRIPPSPSGLYFSRPWVSVNGALRGTTTNASWVDYQFQGDSAAKAWLHLDHHIYQVGFGMNGPAPITRARAHKEDRMFSFVNTGRSHVVPMWGDRSLPELVIRDVNTLNSLWAEIEIRIDVQAKNAGSAVEAMPTVVFNTHHWPLEPIG